MSFSYKEKDGLLMLKSDFLKENEGVKHFYSTRKGGTSIGFHESLSFRYSSNTETSVHKNFSIAASALGRSFDDIVRTQQVHKSKVSVVFGGSGYRTAAADNDALITNIKGVVLSGFYADCQLLMFFDKKNQAIGVCHSGWRGTALDIAKETIDAMSFNYGTAAQDLIVTIGPGICQSCFECDKDVYDAFISAFGSEVKKHFIFDGKKYYPNIGAITVDRLCKRGVLRENVDISAICTFSDPLYWSHRQSGDNRGVHGGFITLA